MLNGGDTQSIPEVINLLFEAISRRLVNDWELSQRFRRIYRHDKKKNALENGYLKQRNYLSACRILIFKRNNPAKYIGSIGEPLPALLPKPLKSYHIKKIQTLLNELNLYSSSVDLTSEDHRGWFEFLENALIVIREVKSGGMQARKEEIPVQKIEIELPSSEYTSVKKEIIKERLLNFRVVRWSEPRFYPHAVLDKLRQQHMSGKLVSRFELDIDENRNKLINYVVDMAWRNQSDVTFLNLIRVMTLVRVCFPNTISSKLWEEAELVVKQRFDVRYLLIFLKTRGYWYLRLADDQPRALEPFCELVDRFLKETDIFGYCEAAVRRAILFMHEKSYGEAKQLILNALKLLKASSGNNAYFETLHGSKADGIYSELFITLTRIEIDLGNVDTAFEHSDLALWHAHRDQNQHSLGNIAEDRAKMAFQVDNLDLANKFKKYAIGQFQRCGDYERANLTLELLKFIPDLP